MSIWQDWTKQVYLIVRKPFLRASKIMQARVMNHPNIKVLFEHNAVGLYGENGVEGVHLVKRQGECNEERYDLPIDGFFLAIGHKPNSDIFKDYLDTDEVGYIITEAGTPRTKVPGVFAAGDVADPHYRQAITAAGSGCKAAIEAEKIPICQTTYYNKKQTNPTTNTMTHFLRKMAAAWIILGSVSVGFAQQQMPPIPTDPNVRIGKLDNGLTYYIRHNELPEKRADFYIAQKVGSILEEDNQRGLAHFLEHMCFNGTKNFPDKTLIQYLESIGVKFGENLNAYTSIDETVYNISNVPVIRDGVVDSCLLILHDWADDLTLDPKEIDSERGVIHEEWRTSTNAMMRMYEKSLPTLYPESKYAYRLPIGIMEVVDNFPYQALRDYYEKWYRPDQQGIVVVGDIDVDKIEAKIKKIFSPIKMPDNPAEREYFQVPDNKETIVAIETDKETGKPSSLFMLQT